MTRHESQWTLLSHYCVKESLLPDCPVCWEQTTDVYHVSLGQVFCTCNAGGFQVRKSRLNVTMSFILLWPLLLMNSKLLQNMPMCRNMCRKLNETIVLSRSECILRTIAYCSCVSCHLFSGLVYTNKKIFFFSSIIVKRYSTTSRDSKQQLTPHVIRNGVVAS